MRKLGLILYAVALTGALVLQSQFHPQNARRHSEPMEENIGVKNLWEYLRLRDPTTGEIPRNIRQKELAFAQRIEFPATEARPMSSPTIRATGWTSAGPINAGGRTQAIGIDISNPANVLIATAQGGIWRSADSGQSWSRTTAPGQLKDMTSIVQDQRNGKTNIWYCGTGELLSTTNRRTSVVGDPRWRTTDIGDGMYKSTDSGKSWSVLPATVDASVTTLDSVFDGVWNIVVDNFHSDQDIVYAAGFGAIMRSTDGGTSWARVLGDAAHPSFCTDVQITSNGTLYAYLSQQVASGGSSTTQGVWRSTDGTHWVNITPQNWPSATQRLKIAIAHSDENILYVGGSNDSAGNNPILFKYSYNTGDGSGSGGAWEDRSNNLPSVSFNINTPSTNPEGSNTLGGYAVVLRVFPTNPDVLFFGGTNLYRSEDGFASINQIEWIGGYGPDPNGPFEYPNHHPDNHDLVFSPVDPDIAYSANDGGIFRTHGIRAFDDNTYPVTWQDLDHGDVASILYVVGLDHATPKDSTMAGGFQDQGSWIYLNAKNWGTYDGGDGCYCAIADKKQAFYMSSQFAYINRWILDANLGYVNVTGIRPAGIPDPQFVTPWMLDPANTNEMYLAVNNTLWKNTDLMGIPQNSQQYETSVNWNQIYSLNPNSLISALGMSTVPAHRLYFGTSDGHLYRMDNADNASPTAREITGSIFPKNAFISCVAVDPLNADSIIVCFSNYHVVSLFASNDGGTTWRNISGNLEDNADGSGDGPSTRWVSIVQQKGERLFLVGTSVGLFSTTDISGAATQWTPEGTQTIGRAIVENIDVRQSDGFVAIATQGSGVFTSTVVSGVNSVSGGAAIANAFSVFPNPASGDANVSLSLPRATHLNISVVDLTGKTRAVVRDGMSEAGASQYLIDCSRLPSGTYYVTLSAGDAIETKRLIIEH
ncbi:MAG TPA: T9SS type A sorting domain-containing protein [Candidatus Kapabacteria bacterium]|jgi:photosystem II stability/assembly factor-like uncharacterized protein|nr:T9SS type A sorting domain-containing protein [Candidatus Kapabacteria bacterium]